MSNQVHVNMWEKFVLFDIFDAVRREGAGNPDMTALMVRLESELGRHSENEKEEKDFANLLHKIDK